MIDAITIDEVVRRTGLSSRALRFYEARGLLRPLRTASGRRLFGRVELERVHEILALKKAGLTLEKIKRLVDRKSLDLGTLLSEQLAQLADQAREVEAAREMLQFALSRIEGGEPLDVATLCSLIREGDNIMNETEKWKKVIDRYYTPEEQAHWKENMAKLGPTEHFDNDSYQKQWKDLSSRIEAALPMDPAGQLALGFVREWFSLLEPFSRVATAEMWQGSMKFYERMPEWEGEFNAGFSSKVWHFIREATAAHRAAGHDVGPLPTFL